MAYPTATQTEVFVLATQLHNELQMFLSHTPECYIEGFNAAFRKTSKQPKPKDNCSDEEHDNYIKGFTFGTALRAIVRRKNLGIQDPDEE